MRFGRIKNSYDPHTAQCGIRFGRLAVIVYAREYVRYLSWFLTPCLSMDAVKGVDRYLDFEIKFLCVGIGLRFIWIKKR